MEEGLKSIVKIGETVIEGMDLDVLAKMLRKAGIKGGFIGAGIGSLITLFGTKVAGKLKNKKNAEIIQFPENTEETTEEEDSE